MALLAAGGCSVEPFCLRCEDAAPSGDAAPDGCVPGSVEICNMRDDNCDGFIDEGFFFDSDPFNCGGCGVVCSMPNALPNCVDRQCVIDVCLPGAADLDGEVENGCEAACTVVETVTSDFCDGPDCCDSADNDCDGEEGEDHDIQNDPNNCGGCSSTCDEYPCPHVCGAPFTQTACVEGACTVTGCQANYYDRDGDPLNGCELFCEPTGDDEEECDGVDDDCDGEVDEDYEFAGIPCGPCDLGTLACVDGQTTCDISVETVEVCDGVDNDCDPSTADGEEDPGIGQPCGADDDDGCPQGSTVCDGGSLTCDLGSNPRGEPCGPCGLGEWVCEAGEFVCDGEVEPTDEVCGDGVDNDCDGDIDEDDDDLNIGGSCDEETGTGGVGICEFGRLTCDEGEVVCEGFVPPATDEICNGLDDDCNGAIDDGMPIESRTCGPHMMVFGHIQCRAGEEVCVGFLPTRGELCDGIDNDGDGETDEDAVCPEGSVCDVNNSMCTLECRDVDRPLRCPEGMSCASGRCVGDLCADVECGECEQCDPSSGLCVDRCAGLSCSDGLVCHCGRCWPPTCGVVGCAEGQRCREGRCVEDLCASADCGAEQACADGVCFDVCAYNQCIAIERCVRGVCEEDPCRGLSCPVGSCNPEPEGSTEAECSTECVGVECLPGQVCDLNDGRCIDDPCQGVHCPEETTCRNGSCFAPPPDIPDAGPDADTEAGPDAGPDLRVLATGGGGCACDVSGSTAPHSTALWAALIGLLVFAIRRR